MTQMIAQDMMTGTVLSVTVDMTLPQIAKILVANGISGVPVVDAEGLPVGMITESDLIAPQAKGEGDAKRESWLTHLAEGEPMGPEFLAYLDRPERTAGDVMTAPVISVPESAELQEIAQLLTRYRIKRLPVVRDRRMVGIVSRADLVRQMAEAPAAPSPASRPDGLVSAAFASLDEHFGQSKPVPAPAAAEKEQKPAEAMVTADALRTLMADFDNQKVEQHDKDRQAAVEQRKAQVQDLTEHHVEDANWQDILRRARVAAGEGLKELLLLRFPGELCSDGGRAINAPEDDWPETLRGQAAEIYHLWERDLKPNGFHLFAQVLDFPGGLPGDIGLTLTWGGGKEEATLS